IIFCSFLLSLLEALTSGSWRVACGNSCSAFCDFLPPRDWADASATTTPPRAAAMKIDRTACLLRNFMDHLFRAIALRWRIGSANLTEPAAVRKASISNVRKTLRPAARSSARIAGSLERGLQARSPLAQAGDAVLRVRVGGHPLRLPAARGFDHVFPEVDRLRRIEASLRHQALADLVGFGFLGTRERQEQAELCQGASALGHCLRGTLPVAGAGDRAQHAQHAGSGSLAGHALVGVARIHVADLVADHRRQLVLVARDLEHTGVHADLAARQGEGVGT